MQCEEDVDFDDVVSIKCQKLSRNVCSKQDEDVTIFGLSALQIVKAGLSKCNPLLKSNWLGSDPCKADASMGMMVEDSEKSTSQQRGHRRSKASENVTKHDPACIDLQGRPTPPHATFIRSPPLTAKEDGSRLTPVNSPALNACLPSTLGPAFTEDPSLGRMGSAAVCRPAAARAGKGRTSLAYRSFPDTRHQSPSSRASLSSKRIKKTASPPHPPRLALSGAKTILSDDSFLHLSPMAVSTPSLRFGGLGIVCLSKSDVKTKELQTSSSYPSGRKGSGSSITSLSMCPDSPTYSIASSVPSIVVTPPAVLAPRLMPEKSLQRVQREGVLLEYVEQTAKQSMDFARSNALPNDSKQKLLNVKHDDEEIPHLRAIDTTYMPPPAPPFEDALTPSKADYEARLREDENGLATFKVAVDALLSEYFVFRTVGRTWRLAGQMVTLLQRVMDPHVCEHDNPSNESTPDRGFSAASWDQELPDMCIPSLRAQRWIGERRVPVEWAADKLHEMMNLVMEHVVTGMVALVTDDRAPYETPAALAYLCLSIQNELPLLINLHYRRSKTSSSSTRGTQSPTTPSPMSEWIRVCGLAHGPPMQESHDTRRHNARAIQGGEAPDEASWARILREVNPATIFLTILRRTIQNAYEKGETIRAKATLLAVPPPRKGSRKRWQAANAEVNALKALKDQDRSQVTRGVITEAEFRKRERRRAAIGSAKDIFAVFYFVRLVGELYASRVIGVSVIRQWLQRFFFNTVYHGVPSSYELEAGCALLITVGAALDREAGIIQSPKKRPGPFSSPQTESEASNSLAHVDRHSSTSMGGPSLAARAATLFDRTDNVPANHWILVSPKVVREMHASCSPNGILLKDVHEGANGNKDCGTADRAIAKRTITATMARLREILAIREVDSEGKVWCREVIGLRSRVWQQGESSSCQKIISLRKFQRDFWGS
ncbi:hypothetical protein CBS101457_003820 [Exobasidium rhododendri]|nr:hypothetical protein CBS101457_003820 [Exobasidium rhododendri]